ncbi:unnamed protein product [Rotaria sordida]|uniref:Uncharacterized protein n=1 Tax=Rotaria sordida TaxID=392033 RepID=A0A815K1I1_9BILA|nr:unnamed protein product [Rotaria sordida]CAF1251971.1 unnamed protein product [Rotaria sordida]CAF1387285.1 unnamed protein product [Rotaria sordida]CAF1448600.1 unnamed protein product [Rotaria sordida]CAF1459946.1 unnamed protein product [Rotaria sordida]
MSDQASSTDTSGSTELKAGHAPATKVAGMRVGAPRQRQTSHGEDKNAAATATATDDNTEKVQESSGDNTTGSGATNETTAEDVNNEETTSAVANRAAGEMVAGVFVPIEKAFPTEAVKHIHDKPGTHPKHEIHTHTKQNDQKFINQPRKQ